MLRNILPASTAKSLISTLRDLLRRKMWSAEAVLCPFGSMESQQHQCRSFIGSKRQHSSIPRAARVIGSSLLSATLYDGSSASLAAGCIGRNNEAWQRRVIVPLRLISPLTPTNTPQCEPQAVEGSVSATLPRQMGCRKSMMLSGSDTK